MMSVWSEAVCTCHEGRRGLWYNSTVGEGKGGGEWSASCSDVFSPGERVLIPIQ